MRISTRPRPSAYALALLLAALRLLGVTAVHLLDEDGLFREYLDGRRSSQERPSLRQSRPRREQEEAWSGDEQLGDHDDADDSCKTLRILLTSNDTAVGLIDGFSDFSEIAFGTIQGGKVLISNPDDETDKIGEYTALTTFLSPVNFTDFAVDCYGVGSYQFGVGEQIAFASPCTGLPFFSITGGQGQYFGARGYVEFMIPDPEERGFLHDIHVCTDS